jgi:hypothetical protein
MISGKWKVILDDGSEAESGLGEALGIPSGHDAWVVGDEPVVCLEYLGANNLARTPSSID